MCVRERECEREGYGGREKEGRRARERLRGRERETERGRGREGERNGEDERENEGGREREKEPARERASERKRERACVFACVCAGGQGTGGRSSCQGMHVAYMCIHVAYMWLTCAVRTCGRGGGLGSRPKKIYGKRLGDGVENLMSPTPRR